MYFLPFKSLRTFATTKSAINSGPPRKGNPCESQSLLGVWILVLVYGCLSMRPTVLSEKASILRTSGESLCNESGYLFRLSGRSTYTRTRFASRM